MSGYPPRSLLPGMVNQIREAFGKRLDWVNDMDGYGGHIRLRLDHVTFGDMRSISEICDTKDINVVHHPVSGTEFTPSGDYMEIVVFGRGNR